jgi:hypothetical protein
MNNTATNNSDLKGCFWNAKYEEFSCILSVNGSSVEYAECKKSCPRVCSENHWKCNDKCIPVSQQCDEKCMPLFTHSCNGICIPINKPCNDSCFYKRDVNCHGQCFNAEEEKELIIKNGCTGER